MSYVLCHTENKMRDVVAHELMEGRIPQVYTDGEKYLVSTRDKLHNNITDSVPKGWSECRLP